MTSIHRVNGSALIGIMPSIASYPRAGGVEQIPEAAPGTGPRIPVMSDAYAVSFPWLPDAKERDPNHPPDVILYAPLSEVLSTRLDCDAHYAAYSSPGIEHRLNTSLLSDAALASAGVMMVLFVADVDTPGHVLATDEWFRSEHPKIDALIDAHPGAFVYRTRGGYRIVYLLDVPVMLHTATDAASWSVRYEAYVKHLETFGIVADPKCKDWTRLYRAPLVKRDGVQTDPFETIGDFTNVGRWVCDVEIPAVSSVESSSDFEYQPAADWPASVAPAVAWLRECAPVDGADLFKDVALYLTATHFRLPIDTATGLIRDTLNARRKEKGKTEYALGDTRRQVSNAATSAWAQGIYREQAATRAAFPNWSRALPGTTPANDATPTTDDASDDAIFIIHSGGWGTPPEPVEYLVDTLYPKGTVGLDVADGGGTKTWKNLSLAGAVADGKLWLGRFKTRAAKVYFIDFEADLNEAFRRASILQLGNAPGFLYANPSASLHDEKFWEALPKDGGLYIIDSLSEGSGEIDENSVEAALPLKYARRIARKTGAVFIFIHHTNKKGSIRGSSAVRNASDFVYEFDVSEPTSAGVVTSEITNTRMRRGRRAKPFTVMLSDAHGLQIIGDGSAPPKAGETPENFRLFDRIMAYVRAEAVGRTQLARRLGGKYSDVCKAIKDLEAAGEIVEIERTLRQDSDQYRQLRILGVLEDAVSHLAAGPLMKRAKVQQGDLDRAKRDGVVFELPGRGGYGAQTPRGSK